MKDIFVGLAILFAFFAFILWVANTSHYYDTKKCKEQYGQEAEASPRNRECVMQDGTFRYMR